MKIELLYFEGCPGYERVLPILETATRAEGVDEHVEFRAIETVADAERHRFLGSPTVRIDGEDVEPGAAARSDFGLKCRLYRDADGTAGHPGEELIRQALAHAASQE